MPTVRPALALIAIGAALSGTAYAGASPEIALPPLSQSCEEVGCDEEVAAAYARGKELFAGRMSPSLSAGSLGPSKLSLLRAELPEEGKQVVDRLDGRLSPEELRSLLFYLRARYGVSMRAADAP